MGASDNVRQLKAVAPVSRAQEHLSIRVLQTLEHQCGYYRDRSARNLVVDPAAPDQARLYDALINGGFRRAGDHIFRPQCQECRACIATRIRVGDFVASRSQRRNIRRNEHLSTSIRPARATEEAFDLYERYLTARHSGGGMDNPSDQDFENYLCSSWSSTQFLEFRDQDRLVAVAVTDRVTTGYSAVYTFFDPDFSSHGLGTYAILKQVELAASKALPYVYLGYWLQDHPKMHYKLRFQPLEVLQRGRWQPAPKS